MALIPDLFFMLCSLHDLHTYRVYFGRSLFEGRVARVFWPFQEYGKLLEFAIPVIKFGFWKLRKICVRIFYGMQNLFLVLTKKIGSFRPIFKDFLNFCEIRDFLLTFARFSEKWAWVVGLNENSSVACTFI